jgi:NitT/TauT family transport system permease protein
MSAGLLPGQRRKRQLALFGFRETVSKSTQRLVAVVTVGAITCVWSLLHYAALFPEAFFPGPETVLRTGATMFAYQGFAVDVLASSARIGVAFAVAAVLAIPVGLLMSSFKIAEAALEPVVEFVRYVPVPALLPLFVLWTGIAETPKFMVLFFGTFFQLVLLIKDDADHVPRQYFDLARTLGARTPELVRDVLVPYLLPQIYDRLRVTLGWCWTYLVIAELIAVQRGVGLVLKEAQRFNAADQMFVCFITLGAIGVATDLLAKAGYVRLFPHAPKPGHGIA